MLMSSVSHAWGTLDRKSTLFKLFANFFLKGVVFMFWQDIVYIELLYFVTNFELVWTCNKVAVVENAKKCRLYPAFPYLTTKIVLTDCFTGNVLHIVYTVKVKSVLIVTAEKASTAILPIKELQVEPIFRRVLQKKDRPRFSFGKNCLIFKMPLWWRKEVVLERFYYNVVGAMQECSHDNLKIAAKLKYKVSSA